MKNLSKKIVSIALSLSVISLQALVLPAITSATAGLLDTASIQLSDSRPSQTGVTYTGKFKIGTSTTIKCILIQFAANADMTGGVPTALDTTSASKGTLTGTGVTDGNYALYLGHGGSTANGYLQFENSTGESHTAGDSITAVPATGITNTSSSTFYAQITTYSSLTTHTCSSQVDQSNVIALVTVPGLSATVTVQPQLSFSVADYGSAVNGSGDTSPVTTSNSSIPFGTVAAGTTHWGSQTLTTSTNAAHGYSVYVRYSGAMTDVNTDTIRNQACASSDCTTAANAQSFDGSSSQSSLAYTADGPGVSFGSNNWLGLTTTNTQIATRTSAQSGDAFHVEYKVEISNTQAPGSYSNTVIYTATPSY